MGRFAKTPLPAEYRQRPMGDNAFTRDIRMGPPALPDQYTG